MTDYSVNPSEVDALAAALGSSARGLHDHLSALSLSAHVLAGDWLGAASNAYQGRQAAWLQDMAELAQALEGAADAARTAADAYTKADERVGALWSIG
jgi:WXG100 family type VII secretion target